MNIIVAGDFCPRDRVALAFEQENYASVLSEVQSFTSEADYSIVNFECAVVTGDAKPIEKCGPNLRCSPKGVAAVKYAGFNCVTLANNHFRDFGDDGVKETLKTLDEHGVDHVGGDMNLEEASQILYKDIAGQKLAIVNCCENEFSIATTNNAGSNPLNPIKQYYAIKEARKQSDYVLVIVHGGHEHWQLPSPRMQETYRFFVDAGADVVVNHHQHCYSGYEVYNGKPIFYGLGNFCFDKPEKRSGMWTEGYAVSIDFSSQKISFSILPYQQCAEEAKVAFVQRDVYNNRLLELNDIIASSEKLAEETQVYFTQGFGKYSGILEPFRNKFYRACMQRGLLPSFITKERLLIAEDYICCESHRDRFVYYLNSTLNSK